MLRLEKMSGLKYEFLSEIYKDICFEFISEILGWLVVEID